MEPAAGRSEGCRIFCIASAAYYPGVVATLNSLRLVGHGEEVQVLDCGLLPAQRRALAAHATVVEAPRDVPPYLLKWALPAASPAPVSVLLDSDVIVTDRLDRLVETAAAGAVVGVADRIVRRFRPEWGELGLGPVEPRPYLNAGVVAVPAARLGPLVEAVERVLAGVDPARGLFGGRPDVDYAFYFADQDALNAVLATWPADASVALDHELAPFPPFPGLRLLDRRSLAVAYADGRRPLLLHHIGRKPWLARTRRTVFSELLPRVLLADDVTLRLDPAELPLRLRGGAAARGPELAAHLCGTLAAQRGRLGLRRAIAARLG
ncbi:MAG: hypothetical protein R3C15_08055 [Thermoleophilia bacterium]